MNTFILILNIIAKFTLAFASGYFFAKGYTDKKKKYIVFGLILLTLSILVKFT